MSDALTDTLTTYQGLPALALQLPDGSTAHISPLGGQVLSWNPAGRGERLYLSPKADPGRPIRGGVPVIFPQFGERGPLPRHGFVRNLPWNVSSVTHDIKAGYAAAVLSLEDDETTRQIWPHAFRAELSVGLSESRLDLELEIENRGEHPFEFTGALHTYLKVAEVEECQLAGLYGCHYEDQVTGSSRRETGPELMVEGEVDRIYHRVPRPLLLQEAQRALAIHAEGFPDVVVWNPWEHKCAALPDMPANGFRHMLCIEAAAVAEPVKLAPGESWWGRQTLLAL